MSRASRYKFFGVMVMAALLFLIFASMVGFGQTPSSIPSPSPSPSASPSTTTTEKKEEHATITGTGEVAHPEEAVAPVDYFFPDLAPDLTTFKNKAFTVRIGFAVLYDYTLVGQDSISRSQVGQQASMRDLRAGRLVFSGQFNFRRPWTYLFAGDFNEFRESGDRVFDGLDASLTIPLWKNARITIGKQKEPFIYEMIGDAANLPQQERVLNPFFTSRNTGIRYQDRYLNGRVSFNIGVYNDWHKSDRTIKESGTQVSARVTGLPIYEKDGRDFLHLGFGFRHLGADKDTLRYKGRPESNVIDNYVDTGDISAKYARQIGLEALYNAGPFSMLTEYVHAWVNSSVTGNPEFNGAYVTGSYVLTGETRPYDKRVGYARRIIPKSRWGAVELVGRFGYVDLDDTLVRGGKMKTWYAGGNWWMSRQWKFGMGYGLADLDRFNVTGRTQRLFARLQWIY